MIQNIDILKKQYCFPRNKPKFKSFYWSLDGGGRKIIKDIIKNQNISLMLEIGVFLGGSSKQWLKTSKELTLIGVDPFPNFINYFIKNYERYKKNIDLGEHNYESLLEQLQSENGTYLSVVTNLWNYQERFIPIKGKSPSILYKLHELNIIPELIYIDSNHEFQELLIIKNLFPSAIITGNAWRWEKDNHFPVQEKIEAFAKQYGYTVITSQGSWVLERKINSSKLTLNNLILESDKLSNSNNIKVRNGLGDLKSHLTNKIGKIAYLGASVTAQKQGYRFFLHRWLQEHFQQSHIEVNGGIGGVVSGAAVFLMDNTVVRYKPDLCFIEYSTVDMSWNRSDIIYAIEGMVKKLKAIDCQICFLYLYRDDREFGSFNPVISMYEEIAEFYNIPSINVGKYIEICLKEKKFALEDLFRDGIHSNSIGGEFMAQYISESLKSILNKRDLQLSKSPSHDQYKYLDSKAYTFGKVIPINEQMIADRHNYQVRHFKEERIHKQYKYYQIDSTNEIKFSIQGKLIAIVAIVGKKSGVVELITPKQSSEYNFWDIHCHYERFHAIPIYRSFEQETNVILRVTEKQIDYSLCRRQIINPETIVKQLKIVSLLVHGRVNSFTKIE